MPELLLELFSEEIPARMQARAAADLGRLVAEALAALSPAELRTFHGPRRIALAATVNPGVPAASATERGPRSTAPEQALAGFLRKHGATRDQLVQEGDHWVLHKQTAGQDAATLIAAALPPLLRRFPWPKSMRWGGTGSNFTWVRPLRRILCILDGGTVPFTLAEGADDGHGLHSGNETEGHRFMAPGPFPVHSASEWQAGLLAKRVMVNAAQRRQHIADGVARLAAEQGLTVVEDPALLDEVAGLVEWPIPLLGRIDPAFMDLPPEVLQVSMRVNQRYFALRHGDGTAAPAFAFASNIEAPDGGAAIVAGNERVLRARFGDARHFWDADRKVKLADRVAALNAITFHAKLGSQGARVRRIKQLAEAIAPDVGADPALAGCAAWLAKADLTTGMVGEFPELQGVMGRYYALHDEVKPAVADAVRDHYAPKGRTDRVSNAPLAIAVGIADRIDLLCAFEIIEEHATGSRDPYGLRRAALGLIAILYENGLSLNVYKVVKEHCAAFDAVVQTKPLWPEDGVNFFIADRLANYVPELGIGSTYFKAIASRQGRYREINDVKKLVQSTRIFESFIGCQTGAALLAMHKRVHNILREENIKDRKNLDERYSLPDQRGPVEQDLLGEFDQGFYNYLITYNVSVVFMRQIDEFAFRLEGLAGLQSAVDRYLDTVRVNDSHEGIRANRLRMLYMVCGMLDEVADFQVLIEGSTV